MSFHNYAYFQLLRQAGKYAQAAIVLYARPPGHPLSRVDEITTVFLQQPDVPGFPTIDQLRGTVFWANMLATGMVWILDPNKYFDRPDKIRNNQRRRFVRDSTRCVIQDELPIQLSMDPHLGTNFVWPGLLRMARPLGAVAVADMCLAYMAVQLTHGQPGRQYSANV